MLKRIAKAPGVVAHTTAHYTGSGEFAGKTYHFEFNPMFGPSFTDAAGEILDKQLGPRSNAWKCWLAYHEALMEDCDASRGLARMERERGVE